METINSENITGVILAGGQARRMGGKDKGLVSLQGIPMIEHVIKRLRPQVHGIIINANRNLDDYAKFGVPVVTDELQNFQGPLAGMASALQAVETPVAVFVPCDAPLLPDDYVDRLMTLMNAKQADVVCASHNRRAQPVHALIRTALLPSLRKFLASGERKIDLWYAQHRWYQADFSEYPRAFINVNTLAELKQMNSTSNTQ